MYSMCKNNLSAEVLDQFYQMNTTSGQRRELCLELLHGMNLINKGVSSLARLQTLSEGAKPSVQFFLRAVRQRGQAVILF